MNNQLNEDQWFEQYQPIVNPTGSGFVFNDQSYLFNSFGADLEKIKSQAATDPDTIWTLMDGNCNDDDDEQSDNANCNMVIASGFHSVNVLGYIITKTPCKTDIEIPCE